MRRFLTYTGAAGATAVACVAFAPISQAGDLKEKVGTAAYKKVAWPILSMINPETTHNLSVLACKLGVTPVDRVPDNKRLHTIVFGHNFTNPLGLAAGWDKQGVAVAGALAMGFGHVEVGSVTPLPQPGNDQPRMFRLVDDAGVINRYGFNSEGADVVYNNLKQWRESSKGKGGVLGVNLGKNKEGDAIKDFTYGVEKFGGIADYMVINVSSPNTPGLRSLQKQSELQKLLSAVVKARDKAHPGCPLLVKIAPDLTDEDLVDICKVVIKVGVQGMVVSNTTNSRPATLKDTTNVKGEAGGLSGLPVKDMSTEVLKKVFVLTQGKIPLIGVGGVGTGADVYEKIRAGASLVQMYTRLAYEGPYAVRKIKTDLDYLIKKDGYAGIHEVIGVDAKAQFPGPPQKSFSFF